MRVLIACEFSGIVRDAFIARGHDALSCDLLQSERPGPHYQGDVRDILSDGWDLMVAHPPCTHLAVSGARWFKHKLREQAEALAFVQTLLDAPIPRLALENPVSIISSRIRRPDQIIQPWQFGHPESKTTCLWLKGLQPLRPTQTVRRPAWIPCECCEDFICTIHQTHAYDCSCPDIEVWARRGIDPYSEGGRWENQTPSGQNKLGPSPTRWADRSRTYQGIADAMADQWGTVGTNPAKSCTYVQDLLSLSCT